MSLLIKGARVIDPATRTDFVGDILLEGGRVGKLAPRIEPPAGGEILEAAGKVACPGLIDLHVHLREPGREDEETIASGGKAALSGGFTTIACMPNTDPANDNRAVCDFITSRARQVTLCRVLPVGAISRGRKGEKLAELGELREAGAVAFSDDGNPVMNAALMRRAMEYSRMLEAPVISHAEDLNLSGAGVMHEGLTCTRLGFAPIPAEAESVMVARDIALAELTGAHLHVAHVSSAASVQLIRLAKSRGVKVSAEVTPHHFTLTEEAVASFDTNAKVNPPLRAPQDLRALIAGLQDGTIDAIASDHAPHTLAEKELEFNAAPFGMVGLETALALALTRLWHTGKLSLPQLLAKFTINPAQILGLPQGRLAPGAPADVTIFDPEREVLVNPRNFHSKSVNTPFAGWRLKGKVITSIVGGKVAYCAGA